MIAAIKEANTEKGNTETPVDKVDATIATLENALKAVVQFAASVQMNPAAQEGDTPENELMEIVELLFCNY